MNAMQLTNVLFYVFGAIMVLAALRVITSRHPVHAVLYLVLSFFTGAAIWILLKAEFLALICFWFMSGLSWCSSFSSS